MGGANRAGLPLGPPWSEEVGLLPDGELVVAGVRASALAEQFHTPLYVVDEHAMRAAARAFCEACDQEFVRVGLPPARVSYAAKAMACTEVVRWMVAEGVGIDVCSLGELTVALRAAMPPQRITVHGNNKSVPELQAAVSAGVGCVVIDSLVEVDRLAGIAAQAGVRQRVAIRVTPGVEAHTHEYIQTAHEDQKFGFSIASGAAREAVVAVLGQPALELTGLHCHIGSQILDPELSGHRLAASRLLQLRHEIREQWGHSVPEVILGGGFGIAYLPGEATPAPRELAGTLARVVAQEVERYGDPAPHIGLEPGRAIAGTAGLTLYTVGTVKPVALGDGGVRVYVSVDGGMSDNIRPALYSASYHCQIAGRTSQVPEVVARVVGKHCETGDMVVRDVALPGDVHPGDLLAVPATGAYGYSMASTYNLTPHPAVVAVADGAARLIVRRETVEDLLARDV